LSGFSGPKALAFDSTGNLYVANFDGTIIKVSTSGVAPFVYASPYPNALACDSSGNLYVANGNNNNTVSVFTPSGALLWTLTRFSGPRALAFDSYGDLFVANLDTVNEVTFRGMFSTFIYLSAAAGPLAFDSKGNFYVLDGAVGAVYKVIPTIPCIGPVSTFVPSSALSGADIYGSVTGNYDLISNPGGLAGIANGTNGNIV